MKIRHDLVVWLGLWVLLVSVFVLGLGSLNWMRFYRLAHRGLLTEGIITSLPDMTNHAVSKYSYTVGSQSFNSEGYPHGAVGQKITVFYLPEDPRINCPGDPNGPLHNETVSIGLVALLFPPAIVAGIRFRLRGWKERF